MLIKGLTLASNLTAARLRELLSYDPLTGELIRRSDGSTATRAHSRGYLSVSVDSVSHLAHRLAWLYMTGSWPREQIDHVNGTRTDNRFANLRDVSASVNYQNKRSAISSNRSCGLLGVTWDASRGKWKAAIRVDGRNRFLGRFDRPDEAHATYLDAKRRMHPGCTI